MRAFLRDISGNIESNDVICTRQELDRLCGEDNCSAPLESETVKPYHIAENVLFAASVESAENIIQNDYKFSST